MVQYYSDGLAVAAGGFFPLNNAAYAKGCTASHSAPATIELNKKGVYNVSVDSFATLEAAGDYSIQLYRNGVPMAQIVDYYMAGNPSSFKSQITVTTGNNQVTLSTSQSGSSTLKIKFTSCSTVTATTI